MALYDEPRVLVVPRGHRLDPRPDGRPAPGGPVAETPTRAGERRPLVTGFRDCARAHLLAA